MHHWTATFVTHLSPVDHRSVLYDYQTLIAGVLALIAGAGTGFLIYRQLGEQRTQNGLLNAQINEDRERVRFEREGKLTAARASLPPALSEIIRHAEIVARQLLSLVPDDWLFYPPREGAERDARWFQDIHLHGAIDAFPSKLGDSLLKVLEYSSDATLIDRIASVFRESQILDARTRPLAVGEMLSMNYLAELIVEALALGARAMSLLDFARFNSETVSEASLWMYVDQMRFIAGIHSEMVASYISEQRALPGSPGQGDERGI